MPPRQPIRPEPLEVIDPRWIAKAIAITILAAVVCAWLALCLLFYQGQWQLVLHPRRSNQPLNALNATPIRFDAAETGTPRLSGAFLPATADSPYSQYTVLYLRSGDDSFAQSPQDAATLALLQGLGLNIFVFDYRGFGASDPIHPTTQRMAEDAGAALRFLAGRNVPEDRTILYGTGVGASLATSLALAHPAIPAVILDAPTRPSLEIVNTDPRTRALPVRWLFHENFPLSGLANLPTPKLLISYPPPASAAFQAAATPRITLELPPSAAQQRAPAITRFLDQYLRR